MTRKILSLFIVAVMLFASIGAIAAPFSTRDEDTPDMPETVILFTNDVHCGIEDGWGYAGVAGVKDLFETAGINTLLVDAGDHAQGGPIGTLSHGQYIIDIMNFVGYDLAIPGNHEFDYGMDQFMHLVDSANYPYISANFMHYENGAATAPVFDAYKTFEVGGKKIAFVGATTPEAITKSTPTYFQDAEGNYIYGFCQDQTGDGLVAAIQAGVDAAAAEGADYIFVIGHCGIDEQSSPWMSTELIPRLHNIDGFIDGHSHSVINETVENADGETVFLAQTGTKLANIGMVGIFADGHIEVELEEYSEEYAELADPDTQAFIDGINAEFDELLHTVVAYTDHGLYVNDPETGNRMVRSRETNLGDLCADAYRTLLDADIAFVNGGGVRANINEGEITFENIINVHPFGNEACLVEVTGQQILDALEMGARQCPDENGGFLQVSGLTYEIHTNVEANVVIDEDKMWLGAAGGEYRVQNVMVMDKETGEYQPLDLTKTYKLASHNYMLLNQGDGMAMFGRNNVTILQEDVMIDNAVLISYIQSMPGNDQYEHVVQGYENPYGEGRITIIDYDVPAEVGDVNGDGVIDLADALLAMRAALELVELPDANLAAADMNGDGEVTLVDALIILRTALGLR